MKVWLDLDQKALDAAYDQTVYAPNFTQIAKRMKARSDEMIGRLGEPQFHRYGNSPIETLLYYPSPLPDSPLHVHVHGGAWRQRQARSILFPAEMFAAAGIGFAAIDFISVDETGGDLWPILEQVCKGIAWVAKNARELGADPDRLFLSGFSSGAHLASAAIISDWERHGFPSLPYRAVLLASGMYDLEPVRLSSRSSYVAFTDEVVQAMSAQRHIDRFKIPSVLVHGTLETPEFQRQTRDFTTALRRAGQDTHCIVAQECNHFEVMEMFGNPFSPLGRAVLEQNRN
jgi:arylformamidase